MKDGFSSSRCHPNSNLDDVFVSVTHADSFAEKPCDDPSCRPAQLQKNVKKGPEHSTSCRNIQKSQLLTTSHEQNRH